MVVVSEQVVGAVPSMRVRTCLCSLRGRGDHVVVQRAGSWWWLDRWWGSHGQEGVQHHIVCAGDEQGVTV